jgi:hypothetical protein
MLQRTPRLRTGNIGHREQGETQHFQGIHAKFHDLPPVPVCVVLAARLLRRAINIESATLRWN